MDPPRGTGSRQAAMIALGYVAVATAWILLSGWLLDLRIADPALRSAFEYGKGLAFVAVTGLLLWLLVRRALRREQAIAAEREEAMLRLAENERAATVGMLAGGLAHEFNNLHAVADGHLDLAERAGPDDARLARRIASARAAIGRAAGLTRSLLDLARPGTGERQEVRLDALAHGTLELVRRALEADGIEVVDELAPVPPVQGDPNQLGQVVMNLLINADHAMRTAPQRRLVLRTSVAGDAVRIEVRDTGSGISPEHMQRLFRPFFTTKQGGPGGRPRGTGLGLSVSKAMVEAHGGSIQVRSDPGAGSTFIVDIPAAARGVLKGSTAGSSTTI